MEININFKPLVRLFLAVISVQVILGIALYYSFGTMSDRGTFGDMFGAVNSLFSGLAFAGVIYAILLQREELKLQRKELELTREELARSANAQKKSSEILGQQLSMMKQSYLFEQKKEAIKAHPRIVFNNDYILDERIEITISNRGGTAYDVKGISMSELDIEIPDKIEKESTQLITLRGNVENQRCHSEVCRFDIEFKDILGQKRIKKFEYNTALSG